MGHCFCLTIDDDLGQFEQLRHFFIASLAIGTQADILFMDVRHLRAIGSGAIGGWRGRCSAGLRRKWGSRKAIADAKGSRWGSR